MVDSDKVLKALMSLPCLNANLTINAMNANLTLNATNANSTLNAINANAIEHISVNSKVIDSNEKLYQLVTELHQ